MKRIALFMLVATLVVALTVGTAMAAPGGQGKGKGKARERQGPREGDHLPQGRDDNSRNARAEGTPQAR